MSGAGRRESGGFGGGGAGGGPSNSTAVPTSKPKKFPKFNRIKPNADSQTTTPIVKAEPMSVEIPSLSGPSPFSQRQRPSISGFTQPQPAPIPPLLAKARVMAQSDPRERQPVVPDPRRIGWARERAVPIPLPLPPPVPRPTVPLGRGQRLPLPPPPPVIPDQRPPPLPPHVRAPPSVEWRSSGQETRGNSGWGGDWADLNSTWNDAPPPPPSTAPAAFGSKESGGSWYDDDSGWGVPHPAGWSTAQTRQRRDSWHTTDPRETRDTRDTREIGRATSRDSDRRWVGHESEWDNRGWNNPSNRRNSDHGYRRPSDDRGRGSISNPSGGGGGGARGWDNHRRDEWDGSNRATYDRDEWDRERERERESEWSVQPARPHWNVYRPSEGGGRGDYSRRDQDRDRDRDYQRPRVPERDRDYQRSRDPSRERDRERDREGGWGSYTAPTWEPPKANEVVKPKDVPDRIIKEEVVEETIYGLGLWSKDQNTQASGVWSANGVYDAPPAAAAQTRDSDAVEPEPDHDSGSDMEIDSPTEENGFQSNKATSSPVRAKNKDGQVTGQESEKLGKRKRTQSDAKEAGPLSIRTDLSTTTAGPADQDDSPPRGGIVPPRFKKWGGRNKIDDTPISPIDTSTTTTQDIDSEKPTTAVAAAGAQPSITTAGSEKAPKAKTKSALAKQTKSSAAAASAAAATVPILVDDGLPFPAEHPSEIASNSISRRTRSKTSTTTKRGGAVAASAAHSATTPKEKVKPKEKAKPKGKEKVDEGTATATKVKVKAKGKPKDLEKDKVVEKAVEKAADGEKEKEKPVAKVVEKEKEKEKPAVAKKTKVPKQVDKVDKPDKTDKVEEPKEKQPKAKEKEKEKEKKVAVVKKRKRAQSSISGPLPDTTVAVPSQEPSAASKKVEAPPASTSASAPPPPKDVVVPTMGPPATAEAPRKPLLIKIKRSPQKKKSDAPPEPTKVVIEQHKEEPSNPPEIIDPLQKVELPAPVVPLPLKGKVKATKGRRTKLGADEGPAIGDPRWTVPKKLSKQLQGIDNAETGPFEHYFKSPLQPRIWTGSKEELVAVLPEFGKSKMFNGLTWGISVYPTLLLDTDVNWREVPDDQSGPLGMAFEVEMIRDFICHPLDVLPLPPTAVETKPSSRVKGVPESGLVPIDAQMNVDSVNPSPLSRNNPTILVSDTSTTKANALGDNPTSGIFRSVSNASTASVTGALANIKINRSLGKIGEGASTTNGSAAVETSRCDCTRTNVNRDCICQTGQMDVDDQNATTNGDLLKELPMANVDMDVDDKKPESTTPKLSVQVDRIPFPTIPRRAPSTDHESSQLSSSLKPTDWKWTSGAAVDWGAGERDSSTDSPLSPSYPPSRSFTPPSAGSMASMELSYPPLPSLSQTQSPDPGQSTSITDSQPQSQSQTQSQTQTQPPSSPSTSTPTAPIPMGLGLNFDLNTNPYSSMVALSSMQPSITAGNTHVVPYGYPAYPAPASAFANASYLPVAPTPPFANASFPGYPYTYPYGYPTPPSGAQQLSYAVSLSYPPPGGVMTIPTAPDPTSRVSPAEDVDMADSQPQDPSSVVDSKAADTGASMVVDSGQQEPATEPLQAKANGAKSKGKGKGKATKAALAAADVVDSGGSSSSSSQQPQKKKARPSKSLATALNAAFASTSSNPSSPFTIAPLPNSAPVSSPLDLNSPFTIAPLSNGTASASSPLDPSASTSTAGTTKAKVKTTKKATGKAVTAGSTAKSRKSSKTSTPTTTTPLQNTSNLSGEPEEKVQYHPQPLPVPPDYKALRQPGVPFVLPPEIQVLVESYVDGLPIIVVCERKSLSGVWSGGSGVGAGVGGSGGRKGKGKAEKETDKVREKEGESKGELEVLGKIPLREECAYVWMGYFRVTKVWEKPIPMESPPPSPSDTSSQQPQNLLITKPDRTIGRVSWRFRLRWEFGGEGFQQNLSKITLPGTMLHNCPWWVDSTKTSATAITTAGSTSSSLIKLTKKGIKPPHQDQTSAEEEWGSDDETLPVSYRKMRVNSPNYQFRKDGFEGFDWMVPYYLLGMRGDITKDEMDGMRFKKDKERMLEDAKSKEESAMDMVGVEGSGSSMDNQKKGEEAAPGNWDEDTRDEATGRSRGWFCEKCGRINQSVMLRHRKCESSWCKNEPISKGYALPLFTVRDPQASCVVFVPTNTYPRAYTRKEFQKWDDGMQTIKYEFDYALDPGGDADPLLLSLSSLNEDVNPPPRPESRVEEVKEEVAGVVGGTRRSKRQLEKGKEKEGSGVATATRSKMKLDVTGKGKVARETGKVTFKHIFTSNRRQLQGEPDQLFVDVQMEVQLRKVIGDTGPYYTYTVADQPKKYDGKVVKWNAEDLPKCIPQIKEMLEFYSLAYSNREVPIEVQHLQLVGWVSEGSKKSSLPFEAKNGGVMIMCLGNEAFVTLTPRTAVPIIPTPEEINANRSLYGFGPGFSQPSLPVTPLSEDLIELDGSRTSTADSSVVPSVLNTPMATTSSISGVDLKADLGSLISMDQDVDMGAVKMETTKVEDIPMDDIVMINNGGSSSGAAGSGKGKGKTQGTAPKKASTTKKGSVDSYTFSLVHGDTLVLSGDDFDYSIKRIGTSILLIGSYVEKR